MPSCSICYERFTSPVSLPCGHVFCRECIRRTVDSIKSCSVQHFCPTCRGPYSVLMIDPGLIPPYLRPHILPPIRPVFFDDPTPAPAASPSTSASASASVSPSSSSSKSSSSPSDKGHMVAEANALRLNCAMWRRRAEVHAAANTGLLGFARAAKEHALRMRAERDAARNQCALLKRKLAELLPEPESDLSMEPKPGAAPRVGLPVFLMQCKPADQFYDDPSDMTQSHFGPPMKRRKASPETTCDNVFAGSASGVSAVPATPGVSNSDSAASAPSSRHSAPPSARSASAPSPAYSAPSSIRRHSVSLSSR